MRAEDAGLDAVSAAARTPAVADRSWALVLAAAGPFAVFGLTLPLGPPAG